MSVISQVISNRALPALIKKLKRKPAGKRRAPRIVFTNGVFDILHVGHVQYLAKAKSFGDILIIGINRDSSVRRLKGPGRPLQSENDRAKIVAALAAVNYVTLFGEDTPEKLIHKIRPNVLVKGADYQVSEIVGAEFVKSYGGSVRRVRITPGRSTSKLARALDV